MKQRIELKKNQLQNWINCKLHLLGVRKLPPLEAAIQAYIYDERTRFFSGGCSSWIQGFVGTDAEISRLEQLFAERDFKTRRQLMPSATCPHMLSVRDTSMRKYVKIRRSLPEFPLPPEAGASRARTLWPVPSGCG